MYPLYYQGLRLSVTFQVKHLCVGDFASFAKIFAGFYFGKGIEQQDCFFILTLDGLTCFYPGLGGIGFESQGMNRARVHFFF